MLLFGEAPIIEGRFLKREKRFIGYVKLADGEQVVCHIPNTGRLTELLIPDATVKLVYHPSPTRKTDYTMWAVEYHGVWVSIHSAKANEIVRYYLAANPDIKNLKAEVTKGKSRFDFAYMQGDVQTFVEVKSANLVIEGVALFPDAPTTRGQKHLGELIELKKQGYDAQVIFVVQRNDASSFRPNV